MTIKLSALSWPFLLLGLLAACSGGGSNDPPGSFGPPFKVAVSANVSLSTGELFSGYTTEHQALYAIGLRGAQTAAPWKAMDHNDGITTPPYDLTMIDDTNTGFGLTALAGYGYTSILLNIPIITIGVRSMPADIDTLAFDDALVKARYRALIDQVVPYLNPSVKYVSLGNEVDTYLAAHSSEWAKYKALIEDARAYLKSQKPGILVGVTTTFEGASSTQTANVASLNQNMDIVIYTYYPMNFQTVTARDPSTVAADMAAMVSLAGGKPLVLQEWGYPSSTFVSGSEQKQSDFVAGTFAAWRQHGSDKIPFLSFFKRRDWTAAECANLSGQVSPQPFFEFLCSLGLLKNDGSPKTAYQTLVNEVAGL
jgi:glycosyl hydrolase family 42 (putative beta-galactosidase)